MMFLSNCSSDDEKSAGAKGQFNEEEVMSRIFGDSEILQYTRLFYKEDCSFGTSIETSDDTDYKVLEIIVDGDVSARGYAAKDTGTDEFLYFVDVDWTSSEITTINIVENETKIISSSGIDFLDYIDEVNNGLIAAERFWGWSCGPEYSIEPESCYRNCTYYAMWHQFVPAEPDFRCDNLPGKNPKLND